MALPNQLQSISRQIEVLAGRGLVVTEQDKTVLMRLLIDNGYYRLAEYWRYFQLAPYLGDPAFQPGVQVADIGEVLSRCKKRVTDKNLWIIKNGALKAPGTW